MLYVICTNVVEKNKLDAFYSAAKAHAKKSKEVDEGCISFDVSKYNEETREVLFVEKWESRKDLDVHSRRCAIEPLIKGISENRINKTLKVIEID